MRRLIAHIGLAVAALTTVGTTFVNAFTQTSSNIEYQSGRLFTFQVNEKKEDENAEAVSREGTEEIAKEMERRLNQAKITSYSIKIDGDDTIKVAVSQNSDEEYSFLSTYLSFNGNLALSYGDNYATADEFLLEGNEAYIDTYNGIPCILLPVDTESEDYKALIDAARKDKTDEEYKYAETSTYQDDEGNDQQEYHFYLYLWYNFVEGKCTHEATQDAANSYNERVLMKFEVTSNESGEDDNSLSPQYYPDDKDVKKLYSALNVDTNGDGAASVSEKETAYRRANFFINLINAGELKYDVVSLYDDANPIAATIDTLITTTSDSNHLAVAWSGTFAATICAIVILTFLLVVYYRLSALSISTISITSTYLALLALLLFKAELNTFGIIGLGLVALTSIISGSIYAHKLKEECYRGRSLKKANAEASKKSLLPIVDVNVITVVIGVFCYIFGGALLRNFAVVTVFGGLASLLLNTLGLKGMMWLATNATFLQGKYEVFGVNSEKVPNIINEEKQTYFGAYADTNFTAKKKPVGIVAAVLVLASIVGLSVFGGLEAAGKSTLYATSKTSQASSMYFETTNQNGQFTKDENVKNLLHSLIVYGDGEEPVAPESATDDKNSLLAYVDYTTIQDGENETKSYAFNKFTRTTEEDETTVTYYYTIVNFTSTFEKGANVAYFDGTNFVKASDEDMAIEEQINELTEALITDAKATVSAKACTVYAESKPDFGKVGLGVLVATAVIGVYLILRYRLSRGIASLIVSLGVSTFAVGIFTLLRFLALPSYAIAALPLVAAFTMMVSVIFMNRERELVIEDKKHDNSVENREAIMVKATSSAFDLILPVTIFALYFGINFFGFGPQATAWIYLVIILGVLVAALIVSTVQGPLSQFFYKLFFGVKVFTPKKAKKKIVKVNKSAEPEEATFIGIND